MVMAYCDIDHLKSKISETLGNFLTVDETFYIAYVVYKERKENTQIQEKHSSFIVKKFIPTPYELFYNQNLRLGFVLEEDESVNTFCATTCYMAPEIFLKINYTYKIDIWALGLLIFFMLFGEFPFKSLNVEFEIQKKCAGGFKIANVVGVKPNQSISKLDYTILDEFFRKFFQIDPEKRLCLEDIKKYPWFKKMGFTSKELKQFFSTNKLSQKFMSVPKLLQCKSSEKTTIESGRSSMGETIPILQKQRNIEIEKYFFLREMIDEVEKQKFLKSFEEVAFKYYMLKMLYSEFGKVLEKTGKGEFKKDLENLVISLEKYTSLLTVNIAKITIPKFQPQIYNPKAKSFNDFKQPYRLVIGHVFAKARKNITEDIHIRSQLKLKLFICHVINGVFDSDHNEGIFAHFDKFCSKKRLISKKTENQKGLSFREFKEWINAEEPEKLVETVELMNGKFYKGK